MQYGGEMRHRIPGVSEVVKVDIAGVGCYSSPIPETPTDEMNEAPPAFKRTKQDWMGSTNWSPSHKVTRLYFVMYGLVPNPDTHPKRKCAVCGGRPILRFVGAKGFCAEHLREAWAAQSAEPMPFEECVSYE